MQIELTFCSKKRGLFRSKSFVVSIGKTWIGDAIVK